MRKLIFSSAVFATLILAASCNSSNSGKESDNTSVSAELADESRGEVKSIGIDGELQMPVSGSANQHLSDTVSPAKIKTPVISWDKKIIKSGDLHLETKSLKTFTDGLHGLLAKHGAYIAKEESRHSDRYRSSTWTIKVPVLQFEELINALPGKETTVSDRSISSDDVTTAWFDTKYRLEAKRQMRIKYAEFLSKAKNMEEVLQVQQEINRLQEEIESATGRMNALGSQSAYSTINLNVSEIGPGMTPVDEAPGIFQRLASAFRSGADGFAYLLVGLVSVWPLILVLCLAVYFLRRKNSKATLVKQ